MILNILHMYPDLLNLYGDTGNIECIKKRLSWRGIESRVTKLLAETKFSGLRDFDIIFIGGGSDREQKIVSQKLYPIKEEIKEYVENNKVMLAVCGGYQLLGNYYKTKDEVISGTGILDIETEAYEKRIIGNVILENKLFDKKIVGFENHSGRTNNKKYNSFGKILLAGENNNSEYEGVMYKGVVGTYLHGPLLPKNPSVCDYLLSAALKQKYENFVGLSPLDDFFENMANDTFVKTFLKNKKH